MVSRDDRHGAAAPLLLSAVEAFFSTDFAIVRAVQGFEEPVAGSFAGTCPGGIAASAGTKYADVHLRLERWDQRPPVESGWQDVDELPFAEIPGAGPLEVTGFDRTHAALDITGLGRARVLVHARGRHRYASSDAPPDGKREQWLLQLFPDPEGADALAGGPRRLAGPALYAWIPRNSWQRAVHAWHRSGWSTWFNTSTGFYPVARALSAVGGPASREQLARRAMTYLPRGREDGAPASDGPGPTRTADPQDPSAAPLPRSQDERLALTAGRSVETLGDAVQALVDIGLLLETDSPLGTGLVPHPCPAPVWEVLPLEDWQVRDTRARAVEADARVLADDLLNQQAWAPGQHLQTTLGHLATRNKAPREVLLEALALLPLLGPIRVVVGDPTSTDDSPRGGDPHDGHTPVTITVEPASHAHPS